MSEASTIPTFQPPALRDVPVTIRFSEPQLAVVDRYAATRGLSRAAFIRDAVGHYVATAHPLRA